ncbi:hypothetical protein C8Q73DRAFT_795996 [Cubamyces lactineus]|nr:hypothetical protein C8Q73DRAFT_795996 [Cubamyces lactineus]
MDNINDNMSARQTPITDGTQLVMVLNASYSLHSQPLDGHTGRLQPSAEALFSENVVGSPQNTPGLPATPVVSWTIHATPPVPSTPAPVPSTPAVPRTAIVPSTPIVPSIPVVSNQVPCPPNERDALDRLGLHSSAEGSHLEDLTNDPEPNLDFVPPSPLRRVPAQLLTASTYPTILERPSSPLPRTPPSITQQAPPSYFSSDVLPTVYERTVPLAPSSPHALELERPSTRVSFVTPTRPPEQPAGLPTTWDRSPFQTTSPSPRVPQPPAHLTYTRPTSAVTLEVLEPPSIVNRFPSRRDLLNPLKLYTGHGLESSRLPNSSYKS